MTDEVQNAEARPVMADEHALHGVDLAHAGDELGGVFQVGDGVMQRVQVVAGADLRRVRAADQKQERKG